MKVAGHPAMKDRRARDEFICGFAAAVATLVRTFDRPTMARDIAMSNGFDLRDFAKAGVEEFDLEPIRKAFGRS